MILTEHAILRYRDRVKPMFGFQAAKGELTALLEMAGWELRAGYPDWYPPNDGYADYEGWIELSDGIAAFVADERIVTVVCRASLHPDIRAVRNRRKARKKAARRTRNQSDQRGNSRPMEPEPAWD